MKTISLTKGKFALVDDSDFDIVSKYKWHAELHMKTHWYAFAQIKRKPTSLHRFLLQPMKGEEVDHRNGNGLDNRKSNLRTVKHAQNMWNKRMYKNNHSGFKGVYAVSRGLKKWRARITILGKKISLGYFYDPFTAQLVYKKAARKYFGEFAYQN